MNIATIVGHMGQMPQVRTTQNGTAVCTIGVATNDREKIGGEWQDVTTWHNVTLWAQKADFCDQFAEKGSRVAVSGRMKLEKWEDNDGNERSRVVIVADTFEILFDRSSNERNGGGNTDRGRENGQKSRGAGGGGGRRDDRANNGRRGNGQNFDAPNFDDDDIPF